jgi:two-component system sensor kinase FixL
MTAVNTNDTGFVEAVMNAAIDAIIVIDHAATILRFNRSAERMFGYTESEVLGRNVNLLMAEPMRSQHDGYVRRYLETGHAAVIGMGRELTALRKNGEVFPIRLSLGEARLRDGLCFVGIVHDLSERQANRGKLKALEQQLLHADRLLTLGELTAGIAHEINQPLTAIAAYADAVNHLVEQGPRQDNSSVQSICSRISEQSRRAAAVVDRLRKLVRSGTTSKARHSIRNILNSTLLLFDYELKKTGISLHVQMPDQPPDVFVDEIQIQQILVNLVKNSLDAIAESGRQGGRIDIEIEQQPSNLAISVQDNGPGVSAASLPYLFVPFYTSKAKGVGLGLSICKHIAAVHGGSLGYEPLPAGGSRFTLKLPLSFIG